MTGETLSFLTQISGTWDRSVNKCFYTLVHHCWITSYKCSSKRHNTEISDREELENSISIYSSVYETQLNWRLFSGWQRIYQPSNHETLTLQSLAYVQEEERKIWAADELKLLLIVSGRLCQLSSTVSLLHRTGFIVGAAQGFFELWEQWHKLRLTESVLHLLDLHSSQSIKIVVIHCFVTPAQMIIEFVNLSKASSKNDSIKISFCEFPKVIVCLKLLIYVL